MIEVVGGTTINALSQKRRKMLIVELGRIGASNRMVRLQYVHLFDELNIIFGQGDAVGIYTCSKLDFLLERKANDKTGKLVGVNLRGPRKMLKEQNYKRASISVASLIARHWDYFPKQTWMSMEGEEGVSVASLDGYRNQMLVMAKEHQLVWWIPK